MADSVHIPMSLPEKVRKNELLLREEMLGL